MLVDESGGWKLSASDRKLLECLPRYFKLAPELVIRFGPGCGPVIICTGGAYEKGVATIGGTIVDGACRQTFGCTLPGMISTSGRRSEMLSSVSGKWSCSFVGCEALVEFPAQKASSALAQ